jgi:hypothetical protein
MMAISFHIGTLMYQHKQKILENQYISTLYLLTVYMWNGSVEQISGVRLKQVHLFWDPKQHQSPLLKYSLHDTTNPTMGGSNWLWRFPWLASEAIQANKQTNKHRYKNSKDLSQLFPPCSLYVCLAPRRDKFLEERNSRVLEPESDTVIGTFGLMRCQ